MTTAPLARITAILQGFSDSRLSAEEFVEQYSAAWKELLSEQDGVLAADPQTAATLGALRDGLRQGEISSEEYLHRAGIEYQKVGDLRPAPGSVAATALDHAFVAADAYGSEHPESGAPVVTQDGLLFAAQQALALLED